MISKVQVEQGYDSLGVSRLSSAYESMPENSPMSSSID
jgi:hypothetical protein